MKKQNIVELLSTLIMIMFFYAAFSKYFDWGAFRRSMYNQPFIKPVAIALMIVIPPVEIIAAIMLLFPKTRSKGLWASIILMGIFTIYIATILLHFFPNVPCSCGGIIKALGWKQHLLFNIFFLSISIIGIRLQKDNGKINSKHPAMG